jgi:two-component system sensor histidine kinase AtoS
MALVATGAAVLFHYGFHPLMDERALMLKLAFAIPVSAWYGGLGPGLFATGLGALVILSPMVPPAARLPDSVAAMSATVAEIKTHIVRLDDLVQDYLSLARVAHFERTPHDLGAMVQSWALELQRTAAAHGVAVHLVGTETLGQVVLHASTLRRAVLNLVQNALDAMPQGGTLTLEGQGTATQVQLHVRDTGSGIPAAHLEQIFEPLYTTKPEGTGLGLYIAQEIVAAHGGQLTVQSTAGQGTTFTITLPRATALSTY